VLDAAARAQVEPNSNNLDPATSYLPKELKAVLRLAPLLRRCFVLRILAGLPAQACARLLSLHSDMVERYTCDALQSLARGT
jgi:DNA-directed RNA polymerase specialized sigma24 family protein